VSSIGLVIHARTRKLLDWRLISQRSDGLSVRSANCNSRYEDRRIASRIPVWQLTMTADMNEEPLDDDKIAGQRSPRRGRRVLGWVLLLLTCSGISAFVVRSNDKGPKSAQASSRGAIGPVSITTTTAKKGNIGVYLDAIGTVTPVYTSSITSQANGIVTAVHYAEGQMVQQGDPLIDIDPRSYQAQVVVAQGALDRDTNLLAQGRMDLDRYRAAWARNAIQKQMLDDQEKLVLQLEGTVKNDQGTLQYAQVQLSYCHIVAPIEGRAGLRLIDPGNVVQANQTSTTAGALVVITQIQPITVIFTIAEDSLAEVRSQMRRNTALPVDAYDRAEAVKIASGTVLTLDNQIDTTTGTVKVRALFDNKNETLFPNQFVNTRLLVNTLKGVTLIPTNAIQHNGQSAFVYLIREGAAHMQTITTGVADSGTTAVEGINPGDIVATSSFNRLQNDSKVALADGTSSSAASASKNP
jgi:multidrug efflux system membrane fusion protein